MREDQWSDEPDTADSSLIPRPFSEADAKLSVGLAKVLASTLAPAFASVITPVGSAAAASLANQLIDNSSERWIRGAASRAATAANLAAQESGFDDDEFSRRVTGDLHTEHLAVHVFASAANATTGGQLRLYGTILANAVRDTALVDDELLLATALRPLERPHFRMLAQLNQQPEVSPPDIYWTGRALVSALIWPAASVVSVLLTLQASGLVFLTDVNLADGKGGTWADVEQVGAPIDLLDMAVKVTSFGQLATERAIAANALGD